MSTIAEKLRTWSIQELSLVSESGLNRIPDAENFRCLTKGKNKKMWTYVINYVRCQSSVEKIKRSLLLNQLLKEKKDNNLSFVQNSVNLEKLQTSVSKAEENRMLLKRSLSAIEERILDVEEKIAKNNGQVCQIKQKIAILELLRQFYNEKNGSLKVLLTKILSFKKSLNTYQSAKHCDEILSLSYTYFHNSKTGFEEANLRINDLISAASCLIKEKYFNNEISASLENYQNSFSEFQKSNVLLTDFVIILKEMCDFDMQRFRTANSKIQSVQDFIFIRNKNHPVKELLIQIKYNNVQHSLSAATNKKKTKKLLESKEKIFNDKTESMKCELSDTDFEMKICLLENLSENEGIAISNKYLDEYLETLSYETKKLSRKIWQQNLQTEELGRVISNFYKDADIAFSLVYTAPDVFQKVFDSLSNLQSFVHFNLFNLQTFSLKEYLNVLKVNCFMSDRKLMWDYCKKNKLLEPFFTKSSVHGIPLSAGDRQVLNIQSFENICTLCEKWSCVKKKLQIDLSEATSYVKSDSMDVSEIYSKFMKLLEKMKHLIEKGGICVNEGMLCFNKPKTKIFIQDWWEQNAQFIPHIEHEEKTLKMWIDILYVLSDFEPPNYS